MFDPEEQKIRKKLSRNFVYRLFLYRNLDFQNERSNTVLASKISHKEALSIEGFLNKLCLALKVSPYTLISFKLFHDKVNSFAL